MTSSTAAPAKLSKVAKRAKVEFAAAMAEMQFYGGSPALGSLARAWVQADRRRLVRTGSLNAAERSAA